MAEMFHPVAREVNSDSSRDEDERDGAEHFYPMRRPAVRVVIGSHYIPPAPTAEISRSLYCKVGVDGMVTAMAPASSFAGQNRDMCPATAEVTREVVWLKDRSIAA
jgi:hypothetical protein